MLRRIQTTRAPLAGSSTPFRATSGENSVKSPGRIVDLGLKLHWEK
jgi:hypothetical protein